HTIFSRDWSSDVCSSDLLSWTHYIQLMRIGDENERSYYQQEAELNHWSVRELDRQINSGFFLRLIHSDAEQKTKRVGEKANQTQIGRASCRKRVAFSTLG